MSPRFKTIEEKGGLPSHLITLGLEPNYVFHLMDDLKLDNTTIAKLLADKYGRKVHRSSVAKWRKIHEREQHGTAEKENQGTNL